MSKSLSSHCTTLLLVSAVLLSSCSLQATKVQEQTPVPTITATPLPATATLSPTPAPTLAPTETLVPSPTPIPWPSQPITVENAKGLKEINRWGRGTPLGVQKLKRGDDQFLVLTALGVYLYQTAAPYVLAFFPDADQGCVSQDEKLLAIGLKNGDVQIWDMDDLSLKQTLTHTFPEEITQKIKEEQLVPFYVGGMAFSPDNSEIAVGYADGAIDLFRIGENKPYTTLRHDSFSLWQTDIGLIFHLSYSPDRKTLAVFKYAPSISANRLTFWSLPEGKLISVSEAARFYEFMEPAYLPDRQTLLVSSRKDSYLYLTLWNMQTGKKLNSFPTGLAEIISTEIAQDGKQATVYGSDIQQTYFRRVWTLPDGKLLKNEKLDKHPDQDYYTRINDFLFEQGHYQYSWIDENSRKFAQVGVLDNQKFRVLEKSHWLMFPESVAKPLNLPKEASHTYYDPQEQTISWCTKGVLHFIEKDDQTTTIELPFITACDGVVFSSKRRYAAIWSGNNVWLANLETRKFSKLSFGWYSRDMASDARFSSDEQILVTSRVGMLTVWRVDPLERLADTRHMRYYAGNNTEIAISVDKSFAVALSAGTRAETDASQLKVWRLADAYPLQSINPPFVGVSRPEFTALTLSPNEKLMASGDDFGRIRIWSVQSGEELVSFDTDALPLDMAFTPDGSGLIVVLDDGTVRLWGVP